MEEEADGGLNFAEEPAGHRQPVTEVAGAPHHPFSSAIAVQCWHAPQSYLTRLYRNKWLQRTVKYQCASEERIVKSRQPPDSTSMKICSLTWLSQWPSLLIPFTAVDFIERCSFGRCLYMGLIVLLFGKVCISPRRVDVVNRPLWSSLAK